ncbi:MAG: hypothetical protein J6Y19_05895 [Kiritimatiellae bacterium]|nr:hypothetical protein [Kiritimatiellia bacterium]
MAAGGAGEAVQPVRAGAVEPGEGRIGGGGDAGGKLAAVARVVRGTVGGGAQRGDGAEGVVAGGTDDEGGGVD